MREGGSTRARLFVFRRIIARPVSLSPGDHLGPYEIVAFSSAPAAWARSTGRAIRASIARSRSRSCRRRCRRPAASRPLRPRGTRDLGAQPSAHLHAPRRRRIRRASISSSWSISKARRSPRASRAARSPAAAEALPLRDRDRRRARHGAPLRRRPSRSEARQHDAHEERREAARLRPREGAARSWPRAASRCSDDTAA